MSLQSELIARNDIGWAALAVLTVFWVAVTPAAATEPPLFLDRDLSLAAEHPFGSEPSGGFTRNQEIGGSTDAKAAADVAAGSGSRTGDRVKAGLLSAILPGTGQFYNKQTTKGFVFLGVDVLIWGSYFLFDAQGDSRADTYREYAGIYAGTSGDHDDGYWQAVGRYLDSDAYNEALLREARALQEDPSGLVGGSDIWQWRNETYQANYQQLRADANSAYDRRDFTLLFLVLNRAVAAFDAVRNAGREEDPRHGVRFLGVDVALDVAPSLSDPTTVCSVSRRF